MPRKLQKKVKGTIRVPADYDDADQSDSDHHHSDHDYNPTSPKITQAKGCNAYQKGQIDKTNKSTADTTIDSPTSTSTTLQLNLSEDYNDQNGVNDNDIDEDETGSQVCAMHSYKHLTSSCSGCACQCTSRNIDGIVVDSETEEEDPGLYALLADRHERSAEDDERAYEDAELPALLVNLVHNEHSEDDSQEDIFFRN